jgi:hypothetical protein
MGIRSEEIVDEKVYSLFNLRSSVILKPKIKPDKTQTTHSTHIQYFSKFNSIDIIPIYSQLCEYTSNTKN